MMTMRVILLLMVFVLAVASPTPTMTCVYADNRGQALILSSIETQAPMGHADEIQNSIVTAGYQVTFLRDTNVTIDLLLTKLNNYDVVFWRTNSYATLDHSIYWFVGEVADAVTLQRYAADYAAGWLDSSRGILGVSSDFFRNHLTPGSLNQIKLMVMVASVPGNMESVMVSLGVKAVIGTYRVFSFQTMDTAIARVFSFLAAGLDVGNSVLKTLEPFYNLIVNNQFESSNFPPLTYMGDSTVTIVQRRSLNPNLE